MLFIDYRCIRSDAWLPRLDGEAMLALYFGEYRWTSLK